MNALLPPLPTRELCDAYAILVKGFGKTGSSTAPGLGATVAGLKPASFAQKLWRFLTDVRVLMTTLIEPMHRLARHEMAARPGVLLAVHDWSMIGLSNHPSKADRLTRTHQHDQGYDLATVLLVRADDGSPLGPALLSLATAEGLHSTDPDAPAGLAHVDQILPAMHHVAALNLAPTVVHVIDREADSVRHWRQWDDAKMRALVRTDDRLVLCEGQEMHLSRIVEQLRQAKGLNDAGPALYRGKKAHLKVGEAAVVLHRPAQKTRSNGTKETIAGRPLPLRLVVAEVHDLDDRVLARWLLLTNAPVEVGSAREVAHWYYSRWRIESFHKVLKSSGFQIEDWQQHDGERLLKKLLVGLGACVSIWALERRRDAESAAFQALLMQLSGRQTKRDRRVTTSGLLAGLWVLQGAIGPLARHGPDRLNAMLEQHLPLFATK